jgi:ribosomal protein S18 acetylase RimI-like enzyme
MILDDYPEVTALWRECGMSDEPEDREEDIASLLESSQGTGFVVTVNGRVTGAVLCGSDGRYGYIHHLAVSGDVRKQGIGKSLVGECILFLDRRHVIIMVRENNTVGNAFWDRLQFKNADWVRLRYLKTGE